MSRSSPLLLAWLLIAAPGFATDSDGPILRADLSWVPHDLNRPKPPRVEPLPEEALQALRYCGRSHLLVRWQQTQKLEETGLHRNFRLLRNRAEYQGMLTTKEDFGSCRLHLEWWSPELTAEVRGQKRANSGVFLMGRYEIQILDTIDSTQTYADGQAGAFYGQFPPLANALARRGSGKAMTSHSNALSLTPRVISCAPPA